MSTIKVNEILDASGGNTAQINGATPTAYNTMGRNKIINGDMRIDQRNAGAAVTTANSYPVDRFKIEKNSDDTFSAQQDSSAPVGFTSSTKITITAADASIGSTQYFVVGQYIEGYNVADLNWGSVNAKTVTLSFWVRSSLTGTFGGSLRNGAGDRNYAFTYSISSADTWEQKSVTIAGDTSGTWLTTNGTGIQLCLSLGAGSSRVATAGSWGSGVILGASGQTQVISTLNATWYITGVQLEVGSVATEFERRPYGTELALCQRYYELNAWGATAIANSSTQFWSLHTFRVTKRAAPTASLTVTSNIRYREFGISDRDAASPSIGGSRITTHGANVVLNGFSGLTANALAAVNYTTSGDDGEIFAFSAEL